MTARLTARFDLLRAAIGLFVVLGVVLTALGGYVLLGAFDVSISTDVAVSVLSGTSLLVFAVLLTALLHRGGPRRTGRRSA